ncbi:MAG: translation initiation factor IF-2 [Elusimicrobiota bacterium]
MPVKKKSKLTEKTKPKKPKVKKTKIVAQKTTKPSREEKKRGELGTKGIVIAPKPKPTRIPPAGILKKLKKEKITPVEVKPVPPPTVVEPIVPPVAVAPPAPPQPPQPVVARSKIKIDETITVAELATKLNLKPAELIKKMMSLGILATINQRIATDIAKMVADEFGYDIEVIPLYGEKEIADEYAEDVAKLKPRAPIVTIMGHVDHGKTTLMDAIRQSNIAEKEAGGITQHIGAYKVKVSGGGGTTSGEIVFLDTPGHSAFTAMRARGAHVTDIVILVVAADDGVMPQTIEAIDHARAANVPIIVAINKIDMPTANVQKVKQELANQNLQAEDWGGKTITVELSAKKNIGIDKLLEMILIQAEMMELKANPDRSATGVIVEAHVSDKVGPVATVLIKNGTLKVGDYFVAGITYGKVRAMHDDRKKRLSIAGPSTPVEVMGFQWTPQLGDRFFVIQNEKEARQISEIRQQTKKAEKFLQRKHLTLEDLHKSIKEGKLKELPIILKADVRGSLEALKDSLEKLSTKEVAVKIIHSGIGGINDSDVILATASDAVIIGFNVRSETSAMTIAQREEVEIKTYRIIYEVINDIKSALEGLLEPDKKEIYLGRAKVLKIFKISKVGTIAGCSVIDGKISRTGGIRLLRDNTIVFEGKLYSLKRFKDDVKEVEKGYECGIMLDGFTDLKIGDVIESFTIELIKRKL